MIPPDPTISGASLMVQHLRTLHEDFQKFDIAKQGAHAKPDHIVSKDDLQAVANDGGKSGRFTSSQVEAANFFLSHPEAMARLDTAAATDNKPGIHEPADNRIGELDAKAALRDAQAFDGAQTFQSQQPAVPADGANQAQQDAAMLLHYQDTPPFGALPGEQDQMFTQRLQDHHGDAAYLHDFLGSLGSSVAGRALFNAMGSGGDARNEARDAISTLQSLGLLTDKDFSSGTFKLGGDSSFSLETLMAADRIQQEVEMRRPKMEGVSDAEDTTAYNAFNALLTVESPENKPFIKATAEKYGIEPALLAGTVASEMDFDLSHAAAMSDGAWRNDLLHLGKGPGIASVHYDSLTWALGYLQGSRSKVADEAAQFIRSDPDQAKAADFRNSVESAAIVLAALQEGHKRQGAGASTAQDMAVIWGGYRGGVEGLNPQGDAYSLQGFGKNRLDEPDASKMAEATGDPRAAMGGNAYQSEPYFDYLLKSYA
jgi:hypothetical protein